MKISREKKQFEPITIVLENEEEAITIAECLGYYKTIVSVMHEGERKEIVIRNGLEMWKQLNNVLNKGLGNI